MVYLYAEVLLYGHVVALLAKKVCVSQVYEYYSRKGVMKDITLHQTGL